MHKSNELIEMADEKQGRREAEKERVYDSGENVIDIESGKSLEPNNSKNKSRKKTHTSDESVIMIRLCDKNQKHTTLNQ